MFLNPVISKRAGTEEAKEGCLSFPEIHAPVKRSAKIVISAYNLAGDEVSYEFHGLVGRAAQHEYDHIDGVLFIDRLTLDGLVSVKQALLDLERQFASDRWRGNIPDAQHIASRLAELEELRHLAKLARDAQKANIAVKAGIICHVFFWGGGAKNCWPS